MRLAIRLAMGLAFACLGLGSAPVARGAFLDGRTMIADLTHRTEEDDNEIGVDETFVVGPGVEWMDFGFRPQPIPLPALVDIDVSDTQIRLTAVADLPAVYERGITIGVVGIQDFPGIKAVELTPETNWTNFNMFWISSSSDRVIVNLSGFTVTEGQQIVIDVIPVPEPASAGLGVAALAGAAAMTRRRRGFA